MIDVVSSGLHSGKEKGDGGNKRLSPSNANVTEPRCGSARSQVRSSSLSSVIAKGLRAASCEFANEDEMNNKTDRIRNRIFEAV